MKNLSLVCAKTLFATSFLIANPALVLDAAGTTFRGLGHISGGLDITQARGVSADGSVVVGFGHSDDGREVFRWTDANGMQLMDVQFASDGIDISGEEFWPTGVSADGNVVIGYKSDMLFKWIVNSNRVDLVDVPLGLAEGVSSDGGIVVGRGKLATTPGDWEAIVWDNTGSVTGLGILPAEGDNSRAYDVSSDGSVVIGRSEVTSIPTVEAFRWDAINGMVGLGSLTGESESAARAISADGNVIVGSSSGSAFRWDSSNGMVNLGAFSPTDVSDDGNVVVGNGSPDTFRWDPVSGSQRIQILLVAEGIDITGWHLVEATGVSADGTTIVGVAINPDGLTEAWVVTGLPVPPPQFNLDVTRTGPGAGTVTSDLPGIDCGADCSESYELGTEVILTASPLLGSTFDGWNGGDCVGTSPCMITVDADIFIEAIFGLDTVDLTLNTAGNGSGNVTGDGTYDYGDTAIVAALADTGSSLTGWTGPDAAECMTGSVHMIADKSCTANFILDTHTLTLSTAGDGSGNVTGAGSYNYGDTAIVSATPNTGSTFTGWSGPDDAECTSGTVLMNSDKSCTATFTLNTHTLTLGVAGTGSGGVSGAGTYNYGDTATVSATADPGSTLAGWGGADAAECDTGSVHMTSDKSCAAIFSLDSIVISGAAQIVEAHIVALDSVASEGSNVVVVPTVQIAKRCGDLDGCGVRLLLFGTDVRSIRANLMLAATDGTEWQLHGVDGTLQTEGNLLQNGAETIFDLVTGDYACIFRDTDTNEYELEAVNNRDEIPLECVLRIED